MKTLVLRIVSSSLLVISAVGLGIGNKIVLVDQEKNLSSLLSPPIVQLDSLEESQASGQEMAKKIVEEGSVLLKNNGTLPLDQGIREVNVFGWASIDWSYGAQSSSCSGRVKSEDDTRASLVDFYDALTTYGIEFNPDLKAMYEHYFTPYVYALRDPGAIDNNNVITLHEPIITDENYYSKTLLDAAKGYSDTSIVVITRNAGEDIPADRAMRKGGAGAKSEPSKIYLDLSYEEEMLLSYVGENYENVVVLINSPAAMDLSFLNTIPGIDAAMQVGFTGTHGAEAIPSLLWGETTPSGRLVDTYTYDRDHSFANKSKNPVSFSGGLSSKRFVEYVEGIYVGYKWYETADKEGYWDSYSREILDEEDRPIEVNGFDAIVQYPFGYGLSYAEFDYEFQGISFYKNGEEIPALDKDGEIHFEFKVHNASSFKGKDVVEVYLEAPYTPGEIEKSAKNLVGFGKTITLEPGKSQILDIEVEASDLASYDCYDANSDGHRGYEIEQGNYLFHFAKNSHVDLDTVNLSNGVYSLNVPTQINIDNDKYTGAEIHNLFTGEDAVDGYPLDAIEEGYEPNYIHRNDFPDIESYQGLKSRPSSEQLSNAYFFTKEKGDAWDNADEDIFGNPVDDSPVIWGEDNGMRVYQDGSVTELGYELGQDYNDPKWEELLEQVTVAEALNVINKSYGTPAVNSIGKPVCNEVDGPAQIKCYYQSKPRGVGYPDAVMVAQTWNVELAEDFGLSFAQDMVNVGIHGLWGWGVNLHRTPVGGRNWEYFSEDPFMSGSMVVAASKGLLKGGRYSYIKHFCLNESETNKVECFTFVTEQAYREAYLKPFQMAIEQAGAVGVMTSFNRIGALYSGGSEASITGVLRNEWGFNGAIITDWANNGGYMSIDHQLRAGGDLGMNNNLNGYSGATFNYSATSSNRLQHRMKDVVHHATYSFLRCQYLNKVYNENPDSGTKVIQRASIQSYKWWKTLLIDIDIFVGGGVLLFFVLTMLPSSKPKAKKEGE